MAVLWILFKSDRRPLIEYAGRELARRLGCEIVAAPASDAMLWRSAPPPDAVALHGLRAVEAKALLSLFPTASLRVPVEMPDWGWLTPDPPPVEECVRALKKWIAAPPESRVDKMPPDQRPPLEIDVPGILWLGLSMRHEALAKERDEHGRPRPAENLFGGSRDLRETPLVDRAAAALLDRLPDLFQARTRRKASGCLTLDVDSLRLYPSFASAAKRAFLGRPRSLVELAAIGAGRMADPHLAAALKFAEALKEKGVASTWLWLAKKRHRLDPPAYLASREFAAVAEALGPASPRLEHGLHASYRALERTEWLVEEKKAVERALKAEVVSVRTHYLRWDHAKTPARLAEAGLKVDSTMGFAQFPGYRAGTALPFELIDHAKMAPCGVVETPMAMADSAHLFYLRKPVAELPKAFAAWWAPEERFGSGCALLAHAHNFAGRPELIDDAASLAASRGAALTLHQAAAFFVPSGVGAAKG